MHVGFEYTVTPASLVVFVRCQMYFPYSHVGVLTDQFGSSSAGGVVLLVCEMYSTETVRMVFSFVE